MDLKDVEIDEVLDEICLVTADLYQLSLTIVQNERSRAKTRPSYVKVYRKHVSEETLSLYKLPWEEDLSDPDLIIIKKSLGKRALNALFVHTRKLRKARTKTESLLNPDNLPKLEVKADEEEGSPPRRSVRVTDLRGIQTPSPHKGLLLDTETNVDDDDRALRAILELPKSRDSAKKRTKTNRRRA